jgi:hypothetical protein
MDILSASMDSYDLSPLHHWSLKDYLEENLDFCHELEAAGVTTSSGETTLGQLLEQHFCEGQDDTGWKLEEPNNCKEECDTTAKTSHTPELETTHIEPKYKEYATVEARVKSFKGLKMKLPKKRTRFAEAGLFYMGLQDHVQCFCCGGTLRDWKKGLDPFEEHAGWYGSCPFIKAIKGQEFVDSFCKSADSFAPYLRQAYPV